MTVTALRLDDFDGPIQVGIEDLPAGFSATRGVIEPGRASTTILLSADENAHVDRAVPLRVMGKAQDGARQLAHWASTEDKLKLIALMPKPDITMEAKTRAVILAPGSRPQLRLRSTETTILAGACRWRCTICRRP